MNEKKLVRVNQQLCYGTMFEPTLYEERWLDWNWIFLRLKKNNHKEFLIEETEEHVIYSGCLGTQFVCTVVRGGNSEKWMAMKWQGIEYTYVCSILQIKSNKYQI